MSQKISPDILLRDDARASIISSVIPCMVLAGVAVIGRLASRRIQKAGLLACDYLIIAGLVGAWVISLIIIEEAKLGLGQHIQVVSLVNVREILLTTYIGEIFYSISFPLIKISILLLFRSIFPGKDMVIATNIIGAFVVMWGLALLLVSIFSCKPIHGFWDITVVSECVDSTWFFVGNSIPNITADIAILCLPVRKVWNLKMSRKSKVAVSGMFLLGGFVVIASALRIWFMLSMNNMDVTWSYRGVAVWSAVEMDVAVISACLPTIRPVLRYLFPSFLARLFSKTQDSFKANDPPKVSHVKPSMKKNGNEEFQRLQGCATDKMERGDAGY